MKFKKKKKRKRRTDVFFAGMKTEGKWQLKWTRFNVQNRQNVKKKCTPRQTTWNTFEVIILTWWEMVIDRRNRRRFFPVDIAGYEKWHLVVAIFCSQKNKPQLFCIECNANFVWVFLYEFMCLCCGFIIFSCHIKPKAFHSQKQIAPKVKRKTKVFLWHSASWWLKISFRTE